MIVLSDNKKKVYKNNAGESRREPLLAFVCR